MDWQSGQVSPFAFKRTGDADFPDHISSLVLGPPKSGKTTLLSTFPNIVVADVEAGLMSIAHLNIPYVTIDESQKLQTLLFVLRDETLRAKAAEQMGLEKIESVGIDTMDALQLLFKKERLRAENRTQFQQPDWGWLLDQFRELISAFVSLPLHVAFTVHTKTINKGEDLHVTMPGLQGAIGEEIAGMVSFSVMTHRTREVNQQGQPYTAYRLQVEGDDSNPHLGNRAGGRLSGYIEPNFQALHKAVYEGLQLAKQQQGQVTFDPQQQVQTPVQINPQSPQPAPQQPAPQPQAQAPEAPVDQQSAPLPQASAAAPQQPTPTPAPGAGAPPQSAPPSDSDQPISEAAFGHVKRILGEWGFVVPDGVREWTMGFARDVASMFVSTKDDVANGKFEGGSDAAVEYLREYLKAEGVYQDPEETPPSDKTIEELLAWVGEDPQRAVKAYEAEIAGRDRKTAKSKLKSFLPEGYTPPDASFEPEAGSGETEASSQQPQPQPEAQPEPAPQQPQPQAEAPAPEQTPVQEQPQPEQTQEGNGQLNADQMGELVEQEMDGQLVDEKKPGMPSRNELMRLDDISQAPPCEETGNPIDDLDIAKLSLSRLGKWLSVDAYIAATKAGAAS